VVDISVGGAMGTARKEDGTVWGWGRSNTLSSVLGNGGTSVPYGTMVRAINSNGSLFNGVAQVSSGVGHTLALKSDGTVWAWGDNSEGAIGIGTNTSSNQLYPAQVRDTAGNPFVGVTAVSGGWRFSLALKADGTAWGWGWAVSGQLGNNNNANTLPFQPRNFPSPVAVLTTSGAQLSGVNQILAGTDNGMARRNDGTVWIWGSDQFGQLGDGNVIYEGLVAKRLNDSVGAAITGVAQMAMGYRHALVLLNDGTALSWGQNLYGELGDGSYSTRTSPVILKDAAGNPFGAIAALRAGDGSTAILRTDGTVWMVGINVRGQLARSTSTASVASPVQVFLADGTPLTGVTQIALFDSTVIVLRNDGTVWGWGDNADGELGFAPTNAVQLSTVPVKISVSGD
jgi:alpha-tubulin suppressor-like RCC1 family protein